MKLLLLFAGLVAATALHASPVYRNVTTDTGDTAVYSTGPYTEIGDRISLAGTERNGSSAAAQFYNSGGAGTFNATLNFYGAAAGNPGVGSLLHSYTTAASSQGGDIIDVSWLLAGLSLPDELVFTVSLANFSAGVDLGLTVFGPPTVGTSSAAFFLVKDNSGFAPATIGNGQDNIFFLLDADPAINVPEPGTAAMVCLAMVMLIGLCRRRGASLT